MIKKNNFVDKINSIEELKTYFKEQGVVLEVVDTPFGSAVVGGATQEELEADKSRLTDLISRYDNPYELRKHLQALQDIKSAGKDDDDYETVTINGNEYLLSVKEQTLRNLNGTVVKKSELSVSLSKEDLLKLWKKF